MSLYMYVYMHVTKKNLNEILAVDSPFQMLVVDIYRLALSLNIPEKLLFLSKSRISYLMGTLFILSV